MSDFFKNGNIDEFQYYSLAHFMPVIIMAILIILIIRYSEKIRNFKYETSIRFVLAFIMFLSDMLYYWLKIANSTISVPDAAVWLPITVCGWACIFGSFLMVSKSQTLFDINYFWVLAGSFFALITPAVITDCGPTHLRYYQFWIQHTTLFIGLFYMMFVHRMRPNKKSIFKSIAMLCVLTAIAIYANEKISGANYLFLTQSKEGKSILDILPTSLAPRLFIMAGILLSGFVVMYLPWYIKDKMDAKKVI